MSLLHVVAAALLLVGSSLVLYTVWAADRAAETAAEPSVTPAEPDRPALRRAA